MKLTPSTTSNGSPLPRRLTFARIRLDGPQRQRRQEPFALLPPLEQVYPFHCDSEHISLQGVDPFFPGVPQTAI